MLVICGFFNNLLSATMETWLKFQMTEDMIYLAAFI